MPVTKIRSDWDSGNLIFFEEAVGRSATGDILTIGTTEVAIGNTGQDVDFKVYLGASDQYVLFDCGNAKVTFAKVDVEINGDLTLDLEDLKLGDGQSLEFGDADGGDIAITFTDGTALAVVATASAENLTIGDDSYAINTTLKGTFTVGKSDTGHDVILYGATASNYLHWDESEDDFIIVGTASRVLHGADAAGNDVIFYGAVASYKTWWDANGDTNGTWYFGADTKGIMTYWYGDTTAYSVHFDPSGDTNGAWYFGADTKGIQVNLYGDVTGCGVFWDPSTDTNGTLTIGGSGGSKGNDVVIYGATNGAYVKWDQSADDLILAGASRLLLGGDGAGCDAILYGAVASYAVTWDANGDTNGALYFGADTKGILTQWYGDTTAYLVKWDPSGDTNGAWYFGADTKGVQVNLYGDVTGCGVFWDPSTDTNGALTVGGSGGSKGVNLTVYGASNGASLAWDQSADSLIITSPLLNASAGRSLKIDGSVAAAAHADGYGTVEINANFSGAVAGPYATATSTWVNLAEGTTVAASPMITTRNDGIYGPAGLTLTNAKLVLGGRLQCVIDDGANPGSMYLWSTNIYDNALTALFDINSIHDYSDTTAKSSGGIAIPFMKVTAGGEAPGTVYYLNLYTS